MLSIEKNWVREKEADENVVNSFKDLMINYQDELVRFPREFRGETFKTKIVCACEKEISYSNDSGDHTATILEITFLIRNPDDNKIYYHTASIFEEKGKQSAQLHDFLSLCVAQKANALEDSFQKKNYGKMCTYYPNICGCLFIINIAVSGYKGNYEQYKWRFYALDYRTQEEIEEGIKEPAKFNNDLKWLQSVYQKRLENHKQEKPRNQRTSVPERAVNTFGIGDNHQDVPVPQQNAAQSNNLDDDLPF